MDSKRMGNDICLAWPGAELAVMGAGQASAILMRRASPDEVADFEADYRDRLLNPYVAADRGYVDADIDPADTRAKVARALTTLESKREHLQPMTISPSDGPLASRTWPSISLRTTAQAKGRDPDRRWRGRLDRPAQARASGSAT
jgi:hypothetical protein